MATINEVCRAAWEATRAEATIPYDNLTEGYRALLIAQAEKCLAGKWPSEPWKAFETQVLQLADGRGSMQVDKPEEEPPAPTKPKRSKKASG